MHKRNNLFEPFGLFILLLFIYFSLIILVQWWRSQGWFSSLAIVPLVPWAFVGLLSIVVWGGISYYISLLWKS